MNEPSRAGLGWTVVLRRQPVRIVEGRAEGGYTDAFELICCDCGDDPDLDYRGTSPEFQQIRGPYPIAAGIAGVGALINAHPAAINVAKFGGALFLFSYGLLAARRAWRPSTLKPSDAAPARLAGVLLTAAALTLSTARQSRWTWTPPKNFTAITSSP